MCVLAQMWNWCYQREKSCARDALTKKMQKTKSSGPIISENETRSFFSLCN